MIERSGFSALREHFKQITNLTSREARGEAYRYRREGYNSYNYTFRSLLRGKKIQDIIREAKNQAPSEHPLIAAADVLGSGWVFLKGSFPFARTLFTQGLDYGIGITLNNTRSRLREKWDRRRNRTIDVIEKNVELPSTWRKVDKLLADHRADGFALILVRGIDGVKSIDPSQYLNILREMYKRLSSREGVLLVELPDRIRYEDLVNFTSLAQQHEIDISLGETPRGYSGPRRIMRIDKHPESPQELTFLSN